MFIVLALGMMMQATDGTAPPLREVATALAKIDAAVEIGVLRPQFADLLQQHLPPAIALLKSPPAGLHPDALAAVRQAVNAYGDALGSWRFAGMYVARGQAGVAYALMLESQPAAARESSAPRSLRPGDTIEGRFGDGDDVDSGGGYRDVYDVAIGADGQYRLLFSSKIAASRWACCRCMANGVIGKSNR